MKHRNLAAFLRLPQNAFEWSEEGIMKRKLREFENEEANA